MVDGAILGLMVLGSIRKQAEQVLKEAACSSWLPRTETITQKLYYLNHRLVH